MKIVDRIEEGIAVVTDGERKVEIPIIELPEGTHEGSVLKKTQDGFVSDPIVEAERRTQIARKVHKLFK